MSNTFYPDNDFRNYFEHHGVKGMRWGIRRYRHADGSLTSAGRKHYGYGDVQIKKSKYDDAPVPTMYAYDRHSGKGVELSDRSLHAMEKNVSEATLSVVADAYGISVKRAIRSINENPALRKQVNSLIDGVMARQLSDLAAQYGREVKTRYKPKYTQEQAIAKGYTDLEKKYPNFNDFDQDTQDRLWMDYMNESGLYRYV